MQIHWLTSLLFLHWILLMTLPTLICLPSLPSFLSLLPFFLWFPPSPLFHIKLFFIEAHAAWNSIPPGAAGWNTRLFWAQAKQMLALGVPPETSLHASLLYSLSPTLPLSLVFFFTLTCILSLPCPDTFSQYLFVSLLCLKGYFCPPRSRVSSKESTVLKPQWTLLYGFHLQV